METNALSVANYFIDLSLRDGVELRQYGLMKRVYLTHGWSLAYYDKGALDPRYDVVEAWRHGPVIPSVYHTFKHNRNNPIREKGVIMSYTSSGLGEECVPMLDDADICEMSDRVWHTYKSLSDREIVELLHSEGMPWSMTYEPHCNRRIPDTLTRAYFLAAIEVNKSNWGVSHGK
jgi:uncharacterized phage-associated protein